MNKLKKKIAHIAKHKKHKEAYINTKTGSAIASVCAALLPTIDTIRSSGQSNHRIIQNFLLVSLDPNPNGLAHDTITTFEQIVNTVYTFHEINQCIQFITNIKDEKIFLILSERIAAKAMLFIHDMHQIHSIYIHTDANKSEGDLWNPQWSKIQGVFTDISVLYETIKQDISDYDRNMISISFIETNNETLEEINSSFISMQILKSILSTEQFKEQDIKEFINFYRKLIVNNNIEQKNLDLFEQEYHNHGPIWWYTHPCFLSSLVNRSLYNMEIDIIIKLAFFLHDLHQNITLLHSIQNLSRRDTKSFIVYRSQGITQIDFDQLKKTQDGLLSFNHFLLTTKDRLISLDSILQLIQKSDLIGILFVIKIDLSRPSTPFANIRDVSCIQTDEQILFSLHSIFRIGQIKPINNNNNNNNHRLWEVELTLTANDDPELLILTEYIQEEIAPNRKGWSRWSEFLVKQGEYQKAQELCDTILNQISDINEKGFLNYQLGLIKFYQEEYLEAIELYNLSLEIREKTLSPKHIDRAICYQQLSLVYEKIGEYSKALSCLEQALEIYEIILPDNDLRLATHNNDIGRILCQLEDYSKGIVYYEKALEIYEKLLPSTDSDLLTYYNNIGTIYEKISEYGKAVLLFEKALSIQKKILPANSLDLADLYYNLASIYEKMSEYSIAITYYEKTLEIYEENLPSNHLDLAALNNNIGLVYFQRRDHMNALSFLEKAHEIYRKNLPADHSNLAASYACQGAVYEKIEKYNKALVYYKKAFEIYSKTDPLNEMNLATSYNNIGSIYFQTGEYKAALSCHTKVLEIYQKHLSSNDFDLANAYAWHANIYDKMGDYFKALSYYKYAVESGQSSLSADHSSLQLWKDNIDTMEKRLRMTF